jgi:methylaspartate ammonia-lyase
MTNATANVQFADWQPHGTFNFKAVVGLDFVDGHRYMVTFIERTYADGHRDYSKTTRVYGALDALVPELMAEEPYADMAIPSDPELAVDKLRARIWNSWRAGATAAGIEMMTAFLREVSENVVGVDVNPDATLAKVKFNQYAGCSCPCSPGFVLAGQVKSTRTDVNGSTGRPLDIWIDRVDI